MDLNEIMIFVKVVQAGSFNQAAKLLGMPNSTVSAKVSALEKRLGVTLLHRTTRKLQITQAGQAFFNRSLTALQELQGAEAEVTLNQGEPQGVLRLTAPSVFGSTLLPEVISQYLEKYPKMTVDLIFADRVVDLISEGVDLAIRAGELQDSTLIAKKIGVSYFAPFASAAYLKKNGTPIHPKDLRSHKCLQFAPLGRDKWELVNKNKNKISVSLVGKVIADDLHVIKDFALNGEGIALLPTFLCEMETKKNRLVRILPEWRSDVRNIHFVYPPQKFPAPKFQAFMDIALDVLKNRLKETEL
ncbi:LysR family transcriptional regulator [Bdellovibrio sp. 22V]|uniref:LysR family transcriptional regulator n=1 Tax=Bdellovibrio sp. 22V TaxID=3044166 RepID=UPI0025427B2F|nr:LysR family transcriptional regulator [Bdellovibrio sp. 22V]WII73829.1 LysR family transcriptional regulator [Bdellovibrio sp. 22V]